MMRRPVKTIGLILVILPGIWGWAQQSRLNQVRTEIQRLEAELQEREAREKTLLEQVEYLDRQIGLQRKLIREIQTEVSSREKSIQQKETELIRTLEGYEKRKKTVTLRIINLYKRGRMSEWEILLRMRSFNQFLVWLKYQQRIVENDRRNMHLLIEQGMKIDAQRKNLSADLEEKQRLLSENISTAVSLEKNRAVHKGLLDRVRGDKESLAEGIREKRNTYNMIKDRIAREEKRKQDIPAQKVNGRFDKLRGKLDWPVQGRIVTKYGLERHPILKNINIQNQGIEIEAGDHSLVRSVGAGQVLMVQWQRSMGNLVLIDHGGGYYTVYGKLDEVLVSTGDALETGGILGRTGAADGLYGTNLHFEIWKGNEHYDPETWLR